MDLGGRMLLSGCYDILDGLYDIARYFGAFWDASSVLQGCCLAGLNSF